MKFSMRKSKSLLGQDFLSVEGNKFKKLLWRINTQELLLGKYNNLEIIILNVILLMLLLLLITNVTTNSFMATTKQFFSF